MPRRSISPELLAEISAARAAGRFDQRQPWWPVNVYFDRSADRVMIEFRDGVSLGIPPDALRELHGATRAQLESVELVGDAVRWDEIDVDISVRGLISDLLGPRLSTQASGRIGGKSKSKAKAVAARVNGKRGGRPSGRG